MTTKFSDQLRQAIDGSGRSRYSVCKEIKLAQSAMSRFMAGQSGISLEVIDRLAECLGLAVVVALPKPSKKGG